MRYVYLTNNQLGKDLLAWLKTQRDELVALVVHRDHRAKAVDEIVSLSGLPSSRVFSAEQICDPDGLLALKKLSPEIAVSVLFGDILKPTFLKLFPKGVINLHPSYLPFNRGAYPNVWAIIDQTPAGATLHYIDERVDTGDIIDQQQVAVPADDTGATLYTRLQEVAYEVFVRSWPLLRDERAPRRPQPEGGTSHRISDVRELDRIGLDQTYTGRELINILRARTFPPYRGAYFEQDGRRYYLQLVIEEETQIPDNS